MIITDTREKLPFTQCDSWPADLTFKRQKLDFGDYNLGSIFIERKGISDCINSVLLAKNWKRLQAEMQRFVEYRESEDPNAVLFFVVEGTPMDCADMIAMHRRKLRPSLITKRLKHLEKKYGIEVIWGKNREDACKITLSLLKE